ncbi:MAG: DUF1295 domain-containing protein [Pseudomonadota bacterium]|nr:MAG: DUF1295 domain-containing protein [Pseudomonadota bacterium]
MFDWVAYLWGLAAVVLMALAAWPVSVVKHDVSIVDSLWSLMFLAATLVYLTMLPDTGTRAMLVLFLVTAWAVRLSVHITLRNRGHGEDPRYQAIRQRNEPGFAVKSLYLVFGLQAVLAWIISLPLLPALASPMPIGTFDYLGIALWTAGMVFETVGDHQLSRFKSHPVNRGKVMDRGLWRYTRHPNYFGEFLIWWGFYLLALGAGAWWSIVAPLLITFLLLRVSGVALLERDIMARRPNYAGYIRRTNAFFPGPPRKPTAAVTNHGETVP